MTKQFIVSMTLVKRREKYLDRIIQQLENQTLKPDKILINLSRESFYMDKGFNRKPEIETDLNIEFNYVSNFGPLRKIIPTLKKYWNEDVIILVIDDDRNMAPNALEVIYNTHKRFPKVSFSGRGYNSVATKEVGGYCANCEKIIPKMKTSKTVKAWEIDEPKKVDVLNTGCFWCVTPQMFAKNIFDWDEYIEYGIKLHDEVFLSAMLSKAGTSKFIFPFENIHGDQEVYFENSQKDGMRNSNKSGLSKVVQQHKFEKLFPGR